MNLEVERYEGELRVLRTRVKELEKEVSYMQNELRTVKPTWEQKVSNRTIISRKLIYNGF